MESIKKIVVIICIIIISFDYSYSVASQDPHQEPYKILFIGSSYFNYNDLPALFENLTKSVGKDVYIERQIKSGLYLEDHANSSFTEEKINKEKWDYVILQGVGSITAYPEIYTDHPVYPALVTLRDKIFANCESTKMVFCLPWAYEDGMTWLEGWTDTYEDMQIKIYENTLVYSDDVGFVIAPVGWAWNTVLKEMNYPLHYLHVSDWNHPSLKGSYLMACVIFATIFLESSVDINYYGGLSEAEAKYFQMVASNTVLDSLEVWNITTTTESIKVSIPNKFHLQQNYPNPFNPVTKIKYSLPEDDYAILRINDILGREIATLVQEFQLAGHYEIIFDATHLQSGIYFYTLRTNNFVNIKKCILAK